VAGGGVALLRASANIKVTGVNADQAAGINIVRRALQAPARQIAANAGAEASIVAGKILENKGATFGYNAQTGEYGDMIAMGIVDPVKVVRTALQDAASVAGLLVTTEAMIAEAPKKDSGAGGGHAWRHGRRQWAAWAAWTSNPANLAYAYERAASDAALFRCSDAKRLGDQIGAPASPSADRTESNRQLTPNA